MPNVINKAVSKVSVQPRDSLALASPGVFYKLHERSGTTFEDALGYGPDLTRIGSGATFYDNAGWLTPDGTTDYEQVTSASVGLLDDLLNLSTTFGSICVGFDVFIVAAPSNNEELFFVGHSDTTVGGWGVGINEVGQFELTHHAKGAATRTESNFGGWVYTSNLSQRISVFIDVVYETASTATAYLYINGVYQVSKAIDWLVVSGSTAPYSGATTGSVQAFTLFAMPTSTSTRLRHLNSLGSGARMARLFMARFSNYDAARSLKTAQNLYAYQGEFPANLDQV